MNFYWTTNYLRSFVIETINVFFDYKNLRKKNIKTIKKEVKIMAQAVINKDVRKNCVDVEEVIKKCLSDVERGDIQRLEESLEEKKLSNNISRLISKYNGIYHRDLIPINRVKQKSVYRVYAIY